MSPASKGPEPDIAEEAILGAIIQYRQDDGVDVCRAHGISEASWTIQRHRDVFKVLCNLHENGKKIEVVGLVEELRQQQRPWLGEPGGMQWVTDLPRAVPTGAFLEQHIEIVRTAELGRRRLDQFNLAATRGRAGEPAIEIERDLLRTLDAIRAEDTACAPDRLAARIESAADLERREIPPIRWMIPNLLAEGLNLLCGKPKSGKSVLALQIAVAVAHRDGRLFDAPIDEHGEVLYLGLEDPDRRIQDRLGRWFPDGGFPADLHICYMSRADGGLCGWPRLDAGGLQELDRWFAAHDSARLAVIDVFARIKGRETGGRNRNAYDLDYEALAPVQELAHRHGICVLALWHENKRPGVQADPWDSLSGTSAILGASDGGLLLKRDRSTGSGRMLVSSRDGEEQALAMQFDNELVCWQMLGPASEVLEEGLRREIRDQIAAAGRPLRPCDLAKVLPEQRPSTIRVTLRRMVDNGQLCGNGTDGYSLSRVGRVSAVTPVTAVTHVTGVTGVTAERTEGCDGVTAVAGVTGVTPVTPPLHMELDL